MKYFAYGPNMSGEELNKKGVQFTSRTAAKLQGYRLIFNKYSTKVEGEGKINLVKDANSIIEGALYDIPTYEIKKLDVVYGYPLHYQHQKLKVSLKTGDEIEAVVYMATEDMVEEGLKPLLVGEDPTRIEYLTDKLQRNTQNYARRGVGMFGISGIEIALWDLLGKARNAPVYELLGGATRPRLRPYASLRRYRPELGLGQALACTLPAGTTAGQMVSEALGLPPAEVAIILVNGRQQAPAHPLENGDRVALWPPIAGGATQGRSIERPYRRRG